MRRNASPIRQRLQKRAEMLVAARRLREALPAIFQIPRHLIYGFDYSALERRIASDLSQQQSDVVSTRNEIAQRLFARRSYAESTPAEQQRARAISFGLLYGSSGHLSIETTTGRIRNEALQEKPECNR